MQLRAKSQRFNRNFSKTQKQPDLKHSSFIDRNALVLPRSDTKLVRNLPKSKVLIFWDIS